MSQFTDKLTSLGFTSYVQYLGSEHWREFRERYRGSKYPQECAVCNSADYQLHHVTYEHLGAEELGDVIPLCRPHHEAVHLWLQGARKFVGATRSAVRELRRQLEGLPKNCAKRQRRANQPLHLWRMAGVARKPSGVEDAIRAYRAKLGQYRGYGWVKDYPWIINRPEQPAGAELKSLWARCVAARILSGEIPFGRTGVGGYCSCGKRAKRGTLCCRKCRGSRIEDRGSPCWNI